MHGVVDKTVGITVIIQDITCNTNSGNLFEHKSCLEVAGKL